MIPEPGHTDLNFTDFVILLGVVQGILLTVTGLFRKSRKEKFKGLLFLSMTCIIAEIFLNRTGYMYFAIPLVDFSEPVQFAIPPLIYLAIKEIIPLEKPQRWYLHFIPFAVYLIFFIPFYLAPHEYKLESYYFTHHMVDWKAKGDYSLLRQLNEFRRFQMFIWLFQATVYLVLSFQTLTDYRKRLRKNDPILKEITWWLVFAAVVGILMVVTLVVKMTYFRDIGDHIIATFLTGIIYLSTLTELLKPSVSHPPAADKTNQNESPKMSASGIKEEKKTEILLKLQTAMEERKLYTDSLISVGKLAKITGEPAYLISQVINEKLEVSFYDWIGGLRVEEAKKLLTNPSTGQFTVEQIAEEVGYNSKSAFNKAFRKFAGQTPSEFRTSRKTNL